MEDGENKRIVQKEKNAPKMHIKISTKDKDIYSKKKEINLNLDRTTKNSNKYININTLGNKTVNKNNNIESRIQKLIEENKKLQDELDIIKLEIKIKTDKEISEINSLNNVFSELEKEQIKLSNKNKKLIYKLEEMEKKVSSTFVEKYNFKNIFLRKKEIEKRKDLKVAIKSKEGQMTNIQKFIKYNMKEIKKLKNLNDNYGENEVKEINEELKNLFEQINEYEKEIKNLNRVKDEHKTCNKKINNLKNKLNILENELQYESKKSIMIDKKNDINTKVINTSQTNIPIKFIRNKLIKNDRYKNINKTKSINYDSYNYLFKELRENKKSKNNLSIPHISLRKNITKSYGTLMNLGISSYCNNEIKSRIDNTSPKHYLFSENEKKVLEKLLPSEYINKIDEKYQKVENEINEYDNKFKENEGLKNKINLEKIKNFHINLQKKEQDKIKINLGAKYSQNNKKIVELKKKINAINDSIRKQEFLISAKDVNISEIKNKIEELKKKSL